MQVTGYTVAAANSKAYGGGMIAAPDAVLDDGLLDVGATGNVAQAPLPARARRRSSRASTSRPSRSAWRAAEVRIEADRPFSVYADGDPIAELPATVRVLPRALTVIVPPGGAP